jgi:hypothetical protein
MKKYLAPLLPVFFTLSVYANGPVIDDKLVSSFNILFPQAQNIKWDETADTYIVHFTDEGIRSRVVFSKHGSDFYFTRYYTGERLASAIRLQLKKQHPFKKITGVTEISHYTTKGKPLHTEYFINLEDTYRILNLKIRKNGKIVVLNRFIKAA